MTRRKCNCPWDELNQIADIKIERPYWALITAEPIPSSADKAFESQKRELSGNDRPARVLEALTLNAMYPPNKKWSNRYERAKPGFEYALCEETVMRKNLTGEGGYTKCRWGVCGLGIDSMPDEERIRGERIGIHAVRILS